MNKGKNGSGNQTGSSGAGRVKSSVDQVGRLRPVPNAPSETSKPSGGNDSKSSG